MAERPDPIDEEQLPPQEPDGHGAGRGLIPDGVKKAILSGVGALFMTEEGARRLAHDWKLPKELIGFVGQQAQAAKDEILRVLAEEIRRFLQSETVRRELAKVLESTAVEIHAEIRLKPADGGGPPRPVVQATVQRKRRRPRKARR